MTFWSLLSGWLHQLHEFPRLACAKLWSLGDKARELMREYKIEEDKLCSRISETEYMINMCMENSYQIRYINLNSSNTSKFEYNELSETQT